MGPTLQKRDDLARKLASASWRPIFSSSSLLLRNVVVAKQTCFSTAISISVKKNSFIPFFLGASRTDHLVKKTFFIAWCGHFRFFSSSTRYTKNFFFLEPCAASFWRWKPFLTVVVIFSALLLILFDPGKHATTRALISEVEQRCKCSSSSFLCQVRALSTHTMRNVLFFKRQKTYISLLGWKPNEDLQQFILKWENLGLSLKGTNEFKKCLIAVLHDEKSDWFVVSEYIVDLEWLEDEKKQVILLGAPITCSNASRNFFCPFYLPINNAATRQFSNRTGKRTETKEAAIEEFPTNDAAIFGTEKGKNSGTLFCGHYFS